MKQTLDWEQKAEALAALGELSIKYREVQHRIGSAEPWYVSQGIDVKEGCCLRGAYGNGQTPEEAIEDHWEELVNRLKPGEYLVVGAFSDEERKAVIWNGFMWSSVNEKIKA